MRIELEHTSCWTLDWANSDLIAIGCTNGGCLPSLFCQRVLTFFRRYCYLQRGRRNPQSRCTFVVAIMPQMRSCLPFLLALLPNHYSTAHQSAIRALSWVKIPPASGTGEPLLEQNPTVLATGGYDGVERITDLRDPGGNMMNRTRG